MNRGSFRGTRIQALRSIVDLSPLILGSLLIALVATTPGRASTSCHFQSPISPISPVPVESPPVPQVTVEGPVLRAVPTPPNFIPWVIGLVVVVIVVGVVLYWRSKREGAEGSE
ncbi:MAG: hypothetical protein CEE40_10125 [Chloroflexi bacterium B3_Chlor]|nr:MAG: hypothetical protein CEE40_10125 [Chloroflexi bacterium B3_Chlor]